MHVYVRIYIRKHINTRVNVHKHTLMEIHSTSTLNRFSFASCSCTRIRNARPHIRNYADANFYANRSYAHNHARTHMHTYAQLHARKHAYINFNTCLNTCIYLPTFLTYVHVVI